MLIQLHHQSKKYSDSTKTEMVIQGEIACQEEMSKLLSDAEKAKPLPDDMQWLAVNEDSELFWKTIE